MSDRRAVFTTKWHIPLLLAPTVAALFAFQYIPAIQALRLSFFRARAFGQNPEFVGLDNYIHLFTSAAYHNSLTVTVIFTLAVVGMTMLVGLWVSFMIYRVSSNKTVYMIAAIWPYALPPAVAGAILMFLFHPQVGVVSVNIENLTHLNINWQVKGRQALIVVIIASIWKGLGFNVIFFLAALNKIPRSLTEASKLDGVGDLNLLRKVYLPLMTPTLVFLLVMNTIYAFFSTFAIIDIMTRGGPTNSTNILIYNLYIDSFQYYNLGSGSAQSIILFFIVAALMIVQLRVSDRYGHYG